MSDKFVVSTNTVGEIIVTDVETGNVYHYGSMSNFLGLIRLLNEQDGKIKELKLQLEAFKDKLCELGVSDVKLYGKRYYTGLEEWLND